MADEGLGQGGARVERAFLGVRDEFVGYLSMRYGFALPLIAITDGGTDEYGFRSLVMDQGIRRQNGALGIEFVEWSHLTSFEPAGGRWC